MRSASSGNSAASESSAEVVWASERISIQWPRSMMTISSASSHQKFELVVDQAEARTPGGEERDGDRQPDEEHHAGLAGADLADGADEEWSAADQQRQPNQIPT